MLKDLADSTQAVARYRDIVDHTPVVMWMTDVDGNLALVNRAYREFFGVRLEQVVGPGKWQPLVHPDDVYGYAAEFAESLRNRSVFHCQARVRRADGEWRWIESSAAPRFSPDGEFLGMVGSSPDITLRKQAENECKRNEARLESLLRISQYQADSIQQLLDFALAEAIALTGSKIGYIYHYSEARKEFTLNTWSKQVMQQCAITDQQTVCQLDRTGIWGEAVRQARPIVVNDFHAPNPLKKGCPQGHAPLHKYMSIPVFSADHIVGVVGVANKETDYDNSDIRQLTLLMDAVWKIADRTRAEEALLISERRLREAQRVAHTGYLDVDLISREMVWSEETYRIHGLSPAEFSPTIEATNQRLHPEDKDRVEKQLNAAFQTGSPFDSEHRIVRPDGSIVHLRAQAAIVCDDIGKPLRALGTVIDITDRKKQEQDLRKLNATLRALSKSNQAMIRATEEAPYVQEVCNIVVTDCGYRMAWVGYALADEARTVQVIGHAGIEQGYLSEARITWDDTERGRSPAGTALRTGKISICHDTSTDPRFHPWRQEAAKRGYASSIALPLVADGKCFGALSIYSDKPASLGEDEVPLLAELAHDLAHGITAIRLRQANDRANRAMEAAKAAAEHASKAKDHFIAVLSHELRTPLNPVLATATMLRQDPRFDADTHEQLEVICRNAEMEARLIDDLLDVTRIEQGKVELHRRPVELGAVIRQAAEVCMPDIKVRKLAFTMNLKSVARCLVYGDAARLQQVFWNLLTNAVKFTPAGGQVRVTCRCQGRRQAVVDVSDSGEGIDPIGLTRIFNAFEQAERSISHQFGGLGLGLAISRGLVEMHGGTIEAHSEGRGKGATFTVRLPLLPADTTSVPVASSAAAPSPAVPPRPLRILLVEDHADSARIMARLLSADGHTVQMAADVATALKLARELPFDLLLSDLGLPDGTGLDLLRALRAQGIALPAIALSGYGQEADVQAARNAGFAAHLTKPLVLRRLQQAIAAITT